MKKVLFSIMLLSSIVIKCLEKNNDDEYLCNAICFKDNLRKCGYNEDDWKKGYQNFDPKVKNFILSNCAKRCEDKQQRALLINSFRMEQKLNQKSKD